MNLWINVGLIVLLIILNALLAGSEAALISANKLKVKSDAEKGNKRAIKVMKFTKNPTGFLSTIQIGITFMGFINGAIAADSFTGPVVQMLGLEASWSGWPTIIQILITLILTYFQVVFGELVPKRIAIKKPEAFIYLTVSPLNILAKIMKPFVWLLSVSAKGVSSMFGISADDDEAITEEEIRMMVSAGGIRGVIDRQESDMINNVLDFDDIEVSEIMKHRTEISAISIKSTKDEIIKFALSEQYTRFPVYNQSIDQIIGILHVKDLFKFIADPDARFSLRRLMRKPFFIPDSQKISTVFAQMKQRKNHMAIILDEYGGTAGLVTIEDLLEEIVGDIMDEYDTEEEEDQIKKLSNDEYLIDGLMNIDDVEDVIKAHLPVEEYDTLSGFILGQIGRLPEHNENISVEYNHFIFDVVSYDDKIISKIKVYKKNTTQSEVES